jgi:deazaflavin-dependent oxidoreductase (nitroreductase family)
MSNSLLPRFAAEAIGKCGGRLLRNRRLMRAPIWFYRARLGFVFGSRMLLLEHVGRNSGANRQVVLEVFDHPDHDTYVVASGFGTRAQWFRNVRSNPRVRVAVGIHGPTPATARLLTPPEADESLRAYAERHPRAWGTFRSVIEDTLGSPIAERDTELPMVAFRLDRR